MATEENRAISIILAPPPALLMEESTQQEAHHFASFPNQDISNEDSSILLAISEMPATPTVVLGTSSLPIISSAVISSTFASPMVASSTVTSTTVVLEDSLSTVNPEISLSTLTSPTLASPAVALISTVTSTTEILDTSPTATSTIDVHVPETLSPSVTSSTFVSPPVSLSTATSTMEEHVPETLSPTVTSSTFVLPPVPLSTATSTVFASPALSTSPAEKLETSLTVAMAENADTKIGADKPDSVSVCGTDDASTVNRPFYQAGPRVRPNAFVAVRIPSVQIRKGLESVQGAVVSFDRRLKDSLTSLDKLHLTLLVLRLGDNDDIEKAKATLEAATRKVVKEYKLATEPLKLTFKGLGTFGQNVLFAQIEDGPSKDRLINMAESVKSDFMAENFAGIDLKPFKPHLTVAKMSQMRQQNAHRQRYRNRLSIRREAYDMFLETSFGEQDVEGLELLSMSLPVDSRGYYHCLYRNQFDSV